MAAASPTPMNSNGYEHLSRKPSYRQMSRSYALRPHLRRESPVSGAMIAKVKSHQIAATDSSDDDIPIPMKFSALTKALLNDEPSVVEYSSPNAGQGSRTVRPATTSDGDETSQRSNPLSPGLRRSQSMYSDRNSRNASISARRIVRLSGGSTGSGTKGNQGSSLTAQPMVERTGSPHNSSPRDLITPAPRPRNIRVKGNMANLAMSSPSSKAPLSPPVSPPVDREGIYHVPTTLGQSYSTIGQSSISRYAGTGKLRQGEETGVQGSVRMKRVGKVSGTFLSGPARRGRRRQSEDDQSPASQYTKSAMPAEDMPAENDVSEKQNLGHSDDIGVSRASENADTEAHQAQANHKVHFFSESLPEPVEGVKHHTLHLQQSGFSALRSTSINTSDKSSMARTQPVFKVSALPPALPSMQDQENEPPPTFKKGQPVEYGLLSKVEKVLLRPNPRASLSATPGIASPSRNALAPRSQNTPHRPAPPPPPKMSVLETATATAGAATTSHSKRKRNYIAVNGKAFTRMDCIGRGGSSRVYRVMAENYKLFALKKVTLEDVDELAIRGYKGEIDLLCKLEGVDRVVRLFDWEVNDEKQTLSVLMEIGESDLERILTMRLKTEDARFDINFARFYWREMLECVQSVHQFDIVHSDLKPANFLLVQGRLKLIDFGIANAIQENTVNVHREQTVGTPNYMSPEAIIDSNAKSGLASEAGKMMKLGKPSDVWSLGCILYRMVYGSPPFAHIQNQIHRIMAIPNPKHAIEFPEKGVGDVLVPASLIKTLKWCLERDQHRRPTIAQLLDQRDSFLYPEAVKEGTVEMSQETLRRILTNVVNYCNTKGIPSQAEVAEWPAVYFTKIKELMKEVAS